MRSFRRPVAGLLLSFALLCPSLLATALGQTQGQPAQQQQHEEVLRINTDLVQTDVMVLDKTGHAVTGLTKDQFEVLVDGQPVQLQFFEGVAAGGAKEASKIAAARSGATQGAAAAAASLARRAVPGRSFIFFVDDLHLSQPSIKRTRDLLGNFIDKMAPGDQAMLISPSGQIGFLQQLTDNKTALKMAASRINFQAQASPDPGGRRSMTVSEARAIDRGQKEVLDYKVKEMLDDMGLGRAPDDLSESAQGNQPPPQPIPGNSMGTTGTTSGDQKETAGGIRITQATTTAPGVNLNSRKSQAEMALKSEARRIVQMINSVNSGMLAALESVARGSASLPGRKLVFFISDGFVIDMRDGATSERLRHVVDSAARSGVVIYTINSTGLTADFAGAQSDAFADIEDATGGHNAAVDRTSLALQKTRDEQEILRTIAEETGGRAILNRNDLESGIGQIVGETSSYYLLAWKPQEVAAGKPVFKSIKVSVKGRPDLRVLGRAGFYTQPPPPLEDDTAAAKPSTPAPPAKASEAELRSAVTAPFPRTQMNVVAYSAFVNESPGAYRVTSLIDLSGYQAAADADGKAKGEIDLVAVVLDSTGKSVTSVGQRVTPPSDEGGAKPFRVTAKMPNTLPPGLYQVRVAARDARVARMGSVFQWLELPELKPGKMTLSSMFLTEEAGQGGQGTLEVERRFARASNMVLQFYIYNAALAGSKPDLTASLQILQDGKQLIASPPEPIPVGSDPARVQYGGGFPLADFPPGQYTLQVVVEDRVAKSTATQKLDFVVE